MDKVKISKNYFALKSRCMKEFGTIEGTILETKQKYLEWLESNQAGEGKMLVRKDTTETYSENNCYIGTRQDFYKSRTTHRGGSGYKHVVYDRHYAGYLYRRNNKALFASKDLQKVLEFKERYENGE